MSLIIDSSSINRVKRMLIGVPKGADKAIANAINKSARTAVTGVIRGIRENYTVNSKQIRKSGFNVKRARAGDLKAVITVKGKVLGLNNFKMSPTQPSREVPFAQVKRKGGGKFLGAFVAKMKSGHIDIFERWQDGSAGKIHKYLKAEKPRRKKRGIGKTKGRAFIREFYGPSASYMAKNPEIHANITLNVQKTFNEDVEKQISNILNKQS